MAQVIYTGKGLKAPQTQDLALQALSQFGQQQQTRKTYELETARKDRDKLLEMMEIDPVYATSMSLKNRQAEILDEYFDEATLTTKEIYQKKGGPSTQDLMKAQQSQGRVMAQMERLNAIDSEMLKWGKLTETYPNRYDKGMYLKSVDHVNRTGDMPPEGFGFPAVKDPLLGYRAMAEGLGYKKWTQEGAYENQRWMDAAQTEKEVVKGVSYANAPYKEDDLISMALNNEALQYDIQMSFDRMDDKAKQKEYLDKAGGNPNTAADMLFVDRAKQMGLMQKREDRSTRVYGDIAPPEEKYRTWYEEGNVLKHKDNVVFSPGEIRGGLIKSGYGGTFTSYAPTISVSVADLRFSDEDIKFPAGARVEVQPQALNKETAELEYTVDPSRNGEVIVTVDDLNSVPYGKDYGEVLGGFQYKEKIGRNITAAGKIADVMTQLNAEYGGKFNEYYNKTFGSAGEMTKTKGRKGLVKGLVDWGKKNFGQPSPDLGITDRQLEIYMEKNDISDREEAIRELQEYKSKGLI